MNLQHYCSMNEFAALTGMTPGYVRLLVSQGEIKAVRHPTLDRKPMILRSLASKWDKPRGGRPRISAGKKNGGNSPGGEGWAWPALPSPAASAT